MFKNLFLGNTSINFYEKRKLLQNVLIIEVVFFLIVFVSASLGLLNLNFSVDFTGGTTYQFSSDYDKSDIDEILANEILEVSRYQTFENSNSVLFRAVEGTQSQETQFLNYLANKFDIDANEIEFQRVG